MVSYLDGCIFRAEAKTLETSHLAFCLFRLLLSIWSDKSEYVNGNNRILKEKMINYSWFMSNEELKMTPLPFKNNNNNNNNNSQSRRAEWNVKWLIIIYMIYCELWTLCLDSRCCFRWMFYSQSSGKTNPSNKLVIFRIWFSSIINENEIMNRIE